MRSFEARIFAAVLLLIPAVLQGQEPVAPPLTGAALDSFRLDHDVHSRLKAAIAARDYAAAEQLLIDEAERNPKSQPVLLALANVFFADGKPLNSAIALQKAAKLAPLEERYQLLLALAYMTIGRLNWAKPEFERLAHANQSNAVYPYWLARIAYRKMDISSALKHASRAVQLDPSFMKAYDQLGLCHDAAGEIDSAIAAFETAIRLNREQSMKSPWPSLNLGSLFLRLERFADAEARLRDSITIDGSFPVAHYQLGRVLEKQQRFADAIAELEKAANLDPTYPEPHFALARIYRQQQDARAAVELRTFQKLRKVDQQKGITRPN